MTYILRLSDRPDETSEEVPKSIQSRDGKIYVEVPVNRRDEEAKIIRYICIEV